ncbi:MAG TPA: SufE family protein [Ignavibacteria bacterium]|nr:SufE family protein [Ignavibacteria bacterium]
MNSIDEIENSLVEDFNTFTEWSDKYEYIIDLGKNLTLIPEQFKIDEFKVKGCQSQVWLKPEYKDGKIFFYADSDAIITKGLIALLVKVLSGQKPEDIVNSKLNFLDKIGMKEHLSPTRSNGLSSMINYMKKYAEVYSKK